MKGKVDEERGAVWRSTERLVLLLAIQICDKEEKHANAGNPMYGLQLQKLVSRN